MPGSRWIVIYYDGNEFRAAVLVDEEGTKLPFGVEQLWDRVSSGDFMVNGMVEVLGDEVPMVVINGREVQPETIRV